MGSTSLMLLLIRFFISYQSAASGTVCRPTSPQLQRWLFVGTASKLISFPNHEHHI